MESLQAVPQPPDCSGHWHSSAWEREGLLEQLRSSSSQHQADAKGCRMEASQEGQALHRMGDKHRHAQSVSQTNTELQLGQLEPMLLGGWVGG